MDLAFFVCREEFRSADDFAAKQRNGLMAPGTPRIGNFPARRSTSSTGNACLLAGAGPGKKYDGVQDLGRNLFHGNLFVSSPRRCNQLAAILREVVVKE